MLDGNFTDKAMIGVIIIIMIILSPFALIKHIIKQAKKLTDYFSKNRVIFKNQTKK